MRTVAMLRSAGVGAGDEVVVPAYGNMEIAQSVVDSGARPVFADVDPATYCLSSAAVGSALSPRTAAVIAVHRFGMPADMGPLRAFGQLHGLLVLERTEDAADDEGAGPRRARAAYLDARLTGVLPPVSTAGHTYLQYVVRVPGNGRPDRDAFARALRAKGVGCRVPVQTPLHRTHRFRSDAWLPETERAADETLALPIGPELSRRDLQRLVSACNALGGLLEAAFV
ncbi:DegT/DnrJ/EryC1/StrS family aminotransferase [Streptomyces tsukubensis]|uniref:DegT/DnrJ/EryC1/StrS aminotransferase n=1 Tax=Streptomyces tsukubensis TaxID=83656 RepID=A0A1V3ZZR1_9ACTN|nr:DegT/DnrJ/EryC1/StrS family aminotransferase [Streptomyces tsukubensis]OON71689.1 DegT/DnrJ/EryC1/StrS aminotransferase [Streptomyces tsukubensis]QFR96050.1 DegT/DnrJ/EryC1/StrS aminotransferase [Streptomyces tsukubensis]